MTVDHGEAQLALALGGVVRDKLDDHSLGRQMHLLMISAGSLLLIAEDRLRRLEFWTKGVRDL